MSGELPNDPVMLLSVVNTKLRDYYPSLDLLCAELGADKKELTEKLEMLEYEYDAEQNRFI